MGYLLGWFVSVLDAGQRVGVATGNLGQPGMGTVGGALQTLFRDGDRESELSDICVRIFGFPLTLDRVNGNVLLRIGTPGIPSPPLQHPTQEYADAVLALPALADQGDGVKNYLGMVLHLMTGQASIVVLDEPEAFLHPAQGRALGRHLGQQAAEHNRQLFTATHDRDFVLGLLESDCPTTLLRINRVGTMSSSAALDATEVKDIWDKPALRYSNVLQGLFHRAVAVCEADADCRWYGAVLDQMGRRIGVPSEEVLLVPAGGKAQVPICMNALAALDVRAFAILDFDAILDTDFIITLLDSLKDAGEDLKEEVKRLTRTIKNQLTTPEQKRHAKMAGLQGLPAGDVTRMAKDVVSRLRSCGALVVAVGEMESFDRSLGGHGSAWVTAALTADRHLASPDAEALLEPILSALAPATSRV
ncbi:MAG: hypothetical protein QOH36_743 [Actinomycetota bacterium]|nr:hypothetical protein [Actinomycetota bacterium]